MSKNNIYQTLLTYNLQNKYSSLYKKLDNERQIYNKNNKKQILDNNMSLQHGFIVDLMICEILKEFKNMSTLTREKFINMFYSKKNIKIDDLNIGPFINNVSNCGINYALLNQYINNNLVIIDEIISE